MLEYVIEKRKDCALYSENLGNWKAYFCALGLLVLFWRVFLDIHECV